MEQDFNVAKLAISKSQKKMKIEEFFGNTKKNFFNLMYILLRSETNLFIIEILIIILEFFQLLGFPLDEIFEEDWKQSSFVNISFFFKYFQLLYICKGNYLVYLLSIICYSGYIIFLFVLTIYLSFKMSKFTLKSKISLTILGFFFCINSAMYLPIMSKITILLFRIFFRRL